MFKKSAAPSAAGGYTIAKSLRFRSSASAYLSRTPASAGNRKTWTWSAWVKRGSLSSNQFLLSTGTAGSNDASIYFTSVDFFKFEDRAGTSVATAAVYRDPSAWYHLIVVVDTTQATASNRVKLYVNGSQITSFDGTPTYPTLNADLYINNNTLHYDGRRSDGLYFDGYQAELNFIDGQALTPTSFGSTNSTTGVWQPIAYTGTYGTNGFYLKFTDTSSTAALGTDYSGNSNTWTTNNISLTAGATYDSMTDVPTLTSATAANYAVLNPLDVLNVSGTFSNGNLNYSYSGSGGTNTAGVVSTIAVPSGTKAYFELTSTTATYPLAIGIRKTGTYGTSNQNLGYTANEYSYNLNGNKVNNNTATAYGATFTANDVIGCALDLVNNQVTFYKNGASQGVAFTGLSGDYFFAIGTVSATNPGTGYVNFGQQPWTYNPPTGFVALNTYNLPTSTIVAGNKVMDATTYTGTLLSNSITNAGAFKPDLVWVKSRSAATDNKLTDSVRGVTKGLISNTTGAETTDTQGLTAFGTGGFTVGTNTDYNNLSATYVGWQWQAGQGSTSSNTSGSITSTVSVNATAGFSVVTWTGSGANANVTIGHGLGVAPSMVIIKPRSAAVDWSVTHSSLGSAGLALNLTAAAASGSGWFGGGGAPNYQNTYTSTTFNIQPGSTSNNNYNGSGETLVAYCWSEIAGFSKFGSYTGNGSTDGPFIYTGFRPKFVLIKNASGAFDWITEDTSRNSYNLANSKLSANTSSAEYTSNVIGIDFVSNGFKLRATDDSVTQNGSTFIYAAFAENPFKYALAR